MVLHFDKVLVLPRISFANAQLLHNLSSIQATCGDCIFVYSCPLSILCAVWRIDFVFFFGSKDRPITILFLCACLVCFCLFCCSIVFRCVFPLLCESFAILLTNEYTNQHTRHYVMTAFAAVLENSWMRFEPLSYGKCAFGIRSNRTEEGDPTEN